MERATQKDSINNEQKKKSGWERRQPLSDSDTSRSPDDVSPLDIDNDGQLTSSAELQDIFNEIFPQQEEIVYAFGYGSGVFAQQEQKQTQERDDKEDDDANVGRPQAQETKMLDMILVVRDSLKFHTMNQQINPHHYAPIFRHGGSSCSTWWQRHTIHNVFGSGSWFYNPKVFFNLVETPFLKYGVMEVQDLASDLQNWDSLYIAGRMHKPTATIILDQDSDGTDLWRLQQQHNLPAAVSMALLLAACHDSRQQHNNHETTTCVMSLADLYSHISALSYTGDFRMQVGAEDPNKVNKLVHSPGQLGRFHQLYSKPALEPLVECGLLSLSSSTEDDAISSTTGSSILASTISWNLRDAAAIRHLWEQLPQRFQHLSHFKHHILNITNHSYNNNNTTKNKSMLNRAAQSELQTELHHIVAPAARYQSFKGLWTAGWSKSARYALAKLSKGLLRKK